MKFTLILISLFSLNLFAQDKVEPLEVQRSQNDPQFGGSIRETEEILNKNIASANEALKGYSNILFMRMNTLPIHTSVTRGIAEGDECIENPNAKETGNCLKVEQHDFIEKENQTTKGAKSKQIILFFDLPPNTPSASEKPIPTNLLKIKTKILSNNFAKLHKINLELIDTDPFGSPSHDDKIFVINQTDNFPIDKNTELEGRAMQGKYRLNSMENTKSFPTRNKFKQESYIKSLLLFEKILAKIYFLNELSTNNKIKSDVHFLKKSLQY